MCEGVRTTKLLSGQQTESKREKGHEEDRDRVD